MKVIEAVELYNELKGLKDLSRISSKSRVSLVKSICALRLIADDYKVFRQELNEKLMPEGYEDLLQKVVKHQEAISKGKKSEITQEELTLYVLKDKQFAIPLNKALKEEDFREVDVSLSTIKEEEFDKLCLSNKLDAGQSAIIYNIVE